MKKKNLARRGPAFKKNSFYSSSQIEIPSPEAEEDLDLKISTIDTNFTWG